MSLQYERFGYHRYFRKRLHYRARILVGEYFPYLFLSINAWLRRDFEILQTFQNGESLCVGSEWW